MVVIATNRSQVRSTAAPLSGSNLRQVVYTHLRICLCSPSSINCNRPNVGDALRLGGRVTAGLAERSESCQPPPAAQLSTWVTSSAGWLPENRTSAPTDTVLTDHWTAFPLCPFISKILHNDDANAERLYVVNSELHWQALHMQHSSGSRSSRRHAKLPTGQLADDNEVNSSKWDVAASLPSSGPLDRRCQSQLARLQHARIQRLDFTVSRRVDSSTSWLFMSATWHVGELTTHHSSLLNLPENVLQCNACRSDTVSSVYCISVW